MGENVRQLPAPVVNATAWTDERVKLVRRTCCPGDTSDAEFELFMAQCKRSELDPLLKQAFCVRRRVQVVNARGEEEWIYRNEFQPSEAGMLARAERFPDFEGVIAAAVYDKDHHPPDSPVVVDPAAGVVIHRFNPTVDRGNLRGAWAMLKRKGKLPIVVWLDLAGFIQLKRDGHPIARWKSDPAGMIAKCARVAALRQAYPEAFGGLYIREEMPEEEAEGEEGPIVDAAPSAPALPPPTTKTEIIRGQVLAKAAGAQSARVSRLPIQDESKTPDKPAEAPKPRPFDDLAALAKEHNTTARELLARVGLTRAKQGDVTAEDVDRLRAYLALSASLATKELDA